MAAKPTDIEIFERLSRLEERLDGFEVWKEFFEEETRRRHLEIITAITASKQDLMLHIDERSSSQRRTCDMRHADLEHRLCSEADVIKTRASNALTRWQLVVAIVVALITSSATGAVVNHAIAKGQRQVQIP